MFLMDRIVTKASVAGMSEELHYPKALSLVRTYAYELIERYAKRLLAKTPMRIDC
jgi:hypothetical protein